MKIITLILASAAFLLSCNNKPAETKKKENEPLTVDTSKAPLVGNDKDEHGCIGSAGYQWSSLKNDCIRIFEAGTKLSAAEVVTDKTTATFAIFNSDSSKAELFIPGLSAAGIIFDRKKSDTKVWAKDDWSLEKTVTGLQLKKAGIIQYAE